MVATIVILTLIATYASCVICKKFKDIKKGKFCNCGCGECPSKMKCHKD